MNFRHSSPGLLLLSFSQTCRPSSELDTNDMPSTKISSKGRDVLNRAVSLSNESWSLRKQRSETSSLSDSENIVIDCRA